MAVGEFTLGPSREVTPLIILNNDMDEMRFMRYIMGTSLKLFPLKGKFSIQNTSVRVCREN